jgi:hypothetical protein
MIRVTGPDPRITRTVKSWQWAAERARRVAQLTGSAEIQTRGTNAQIEAAIRQHERSACDGACGSARAGREVLRLRNLARPDGEEA